MRSFKDVRFYDKGRLPKKWSNPYLRNLELVRFRYPTDTVTITKIDMDVWMWKSGESIRKALEAMKERRNEGY